MSAAAAGDGSDGLDVLARQLGFPGVPTLDTPPPKAYDGLPASHLRYRKGVAVASLFGLAGAIAMRVETSARWGTIAEALIGASAQNLLQTALPPLYAQHFVSFSADYSWVLYLILMQVFDNVPQTGVAKNAIFGTAVGLAGATVVALVYSLAMRTLAQTPEGTALREDGGVHNPYPIYFGDWKSQAAQNGVRVLLGAGLITLGKSRHQTSFLIGLGILYLSNSVAQVASEALRFRLQRDRTILDVVSPTYGSDMSRMRYYTRAARTALLLHRALPGALVGIGSAMGGYFWYVLAGLVEGVGDHLGVARFAKVPAPYLTEIRGENPLRTPVEHAFYRAKQVFSFGIVPLYLILAFAGLNTQTGVFDQADTSSRIALFTFSIAMYGSYAASHLARRLFHSMHPEEDRTKSINTLYLWTHFAPGIPTLFLYIYGHMNMGDVALSKDRIESTLFICAAYLSFGWSIGGEANRRGDYPHPRIPTNLTLALLLNFVAMRIIGRGIYQY